jgi:hypothetical protein
MTTRKLNTSNSGANWKDSVVQIGSDGSTGVAAGGSESRSFLPFLPRELIEFVRNNREWVIAGALAVLVLMWGGSMAFGRVRR